MTERSASTLPAARPVYPFTAIVGQETLKDALRLNAVNPRLGGVLIRGEKGTAKSTAVRALGALLPPLRVRARCRFSCDPERPDPGCPDCAGAPAEAATEAFWRPVRLVTLPLGATEDRLLGTLDLEAAIASGTRRFEPGLLAQAHRGLLYVDEVNLLPDFLVDALLDAAAMGVNLVEREGISVSHAAEFVLVGTMNPEEGELRPQLLDRFGLVADVVGLADPADRAEVIRRRIAFEADPRGFLDRWAAEESAERDRIQRARERLSSVRVADEQVLLIARLCAAAQVDGLRADVVTYKAARAHAALAGRDAVTVEDIRAVLPLTLPHRRRRQPFDEPGPTPDSLEDLLAEAEAAPAPSSPTTRGSGSSTALQPPAAGSDNPSGRHDQPSQLDPSDRSVGQEKGLPTATANGAAPPRVFPIGPPLALPLQPDWSPERGRAGRPSRRGPVASAAPRGRVVGARCPSGPIHDLAFGPTLRAAAPWQQARAGSAGGGPLSPCPSREERNRSPASRPGVGVVVGAAPGGRPGSTAGGRLGPETDSRGCAFAGSAPLPAVPCGAPGQPSVPFVEDGEPERGRHGGPPLRGTSDLASPFLPPRLRIWPEDYREAIRSGPTGRLVIFVVDASGSMGAQQRMIATKGAILGLLTESYRRRDRVTLITCHGQQAEVLLPPTRSALLAHRCLQHLPVGGQTPLAAGLRQVDALLRPARWSDPTVRPSLVLVTDGRANVPLPDSPTGDGAADARTTARRLRQQQVPALVVDAERGFVRLGRARQLAHDLGARYLALPDLAAAALAGAVREVLRND